MLRWSKWVEKQSLYSKWIPSRHDLRYSLYLLEGLCNILAKLQLPKGSVCLDIGCGSGHILNVVMSRFKFSGLGLDVCLNVATQGKKALLKAVGENTPLKDRSVKICLMVSVLDHVANTNKTLNEINRILEDDGVFVLQQQICKAHTTFDLTHLRQFDKNGLIRLLLSHFRIVEINYFYAIPNIENSRKLWGIKPVITCLLDGKPMFKVLTKIYCYIGWCFNRSVLILTLQKREVF